MRWILDALPYARDRQVRGGIPLAGVFSFINFECKKGCCPSVRDNGKCEGGFFVKYLVLGIHEIITQF